MTKKTEEVKQAEVKPEEAKTPTAPHVYTAINQVMEALSKEGIGKDRQAQSYKFRGIDDVYNALSKELVKARLCIMPELLEREHIERTTKSGGAIFYITLKAKFVFVSAIDGSSHTVVTYGEAMDSSDKATNKAMSAAYKYAAFMTFCIPTEADKEAPDTELANHEVISRKKEEENKRAELTAFAKEYAADIAKIEESTALDALVSLNAVQMGELQDKLPAWHARLLKVLDDKRASFVEVSQ